MSEHTISDAERGLSDLIDRALAGEGVVITRAGRPAAELKPIRGGGHPVTEADLAWLRERRDRRRSAECDAGSLLSRLRDDDAER
ncbi:prevent-host-death family protein [Methylobacterium sp. BE186]|uniref:type II toxin-antitoxin system Phd/YefM family antitoxin n=1 Tax=Methylobacterium sp. BE186 TaxID=2817715 RepID=UPI0028575928|nr:type II toxin-antitoxin system prevent-host-death family antitoxin [Methylobacterium sp. BE186]MDR7038049.1 prevent-host-death family protein [Methylobacterium sp. BE186]